MAKVLKLLSLLIFISMGYIYSDEDTNMGIVRWSYNSGNGLNGSLSAVDGRLFFGNMSDNFYSLDSMTGEKYWTFNIGNKDNTFISSPFFAKGRIYIGACQGKALYCLDELTGKTNWSFETPAQIESSPRVFGGKAYFGDNSGKLRCIDSENGSGIWDFTAAGSIKGGPLVISSRVYFGCDGGKFYCLDANSGEKIWEFSAGSDIRSSAAFSAGMVYFGAMNGKFYSLDYLDGKEKWEFNAGNGIVSSPGIGDGRLYFGSLDTRLYCLNFITGKKIWDFKTGAGVTASPCAAGGLVYFGSLDKKFYCLDGESGKKIWELETDSPVKSSAVIDDGRFYFGNDSGRIYCVDSGTRDITMGNTLGAQEFYISVSAEETNMITALPETNEVETNTNEETETISNLAGAGSNSLTLPVELTNYITNFITITNYQPSEVSGSSQMNNALPYKYTVQAGSFLSMKRARLVYDRLKKKGYDVFLAFTKIKKTRYYRVRIGRFNSLSDANSLIYSLKEEGLSPVLVKFVK